MRETPRSQGTAGDTGSGRPQHRSGRAFAHTTGASGSGSPHGSDGRTAQTPRGVRHTGPVGRPGTTPPVPGRPLSLLFSAVRSGFRSGLSAFVSVFSVPRRPWRSRRTWGFALCAVLFALVTWRAATDGPVRRADERLELSLAGHGPRPLTEFFADLGSVVVAVPVLALALGYVVWRGRRDRALAAALTMVAVPLLVVPLKFGIDRRGPLTDATGYYPSGHTATAMVAYGAAALLLAPYAGRRRTVPVAVLLTLATGTGLLLRGYHWPLDVLGSLALGGILLLLLDRALRGADSRRARRSAGVGPVRGSTRRSSARTPGR
ncbi:phosphatase PAP2 family protein [Streptomyces liangshanensis]|uniref:Phosphatase PAP2 family protein n=1 Tax=Streptomyces liangshanensis TaxID=2717324 RepID=A0A6G9GVV7_9ACTN|nr:phosphatase PAP2 family protein [Streptomyces liangshanensis]QIQ02402.1 phosphatase PAP2 family protein [Streptomyces liangshanensis]